MSVKSRYSTSLAPAAECREAYVRLGPSDCVLLDQTGVYDGGWLQDSGAGSPCLSEYWVDLFCAPLPGAACVLFRHSSILCSSLDAWLIFFPAALGFQKLLLNFPGYWKPHRASVVFRWPAVRYSRILVAELKSKHG